MPKFFGTDGVRGKAGEELTVELALALSRAAALAFRPKRVLLARDPRLSGPALSAACAAGLASAGADVLDAGILPSPAVSHLVPRENFDLGLVISASHNPPEDNGLKFYNPAGLKLAVEDEERVESFLGLDHFGPAFGRIQNFAEARGRYLDLLRRWTRGLRLSGVGLVLDCAFGATAVIAPEVYGETGARVHLLGAEADGVRINATGAAAPQLLAERVRELSADLGIAFDGDGDRALFVDEKGFLVEGDQLLAALAPHLLAWGEIQRKAVVFTVLANLGAEAYLRERGFEVLRVPVGDRHVAWAMHAHGIELGGEPSGHLVFRRYAATGDGILTGLLVLSYLRRLGRSLRELVAPVPLFAQVRRDIPVRDREGVLRAPEVQRAVAEAERILAGKGRLVVRASGTQPLVRLMAEGPEEALLHEAVERVAEAVRAADRLSRGSGT
ncbi:MAG: phosphoglucosamine mutase [Candidatus Bipolaricaulota bacterium]|nr:phosphoglucosamine mutase [Candidatus Bipolaricaulota bacterium]